MTDGDTTRDGPRVGPRRGLVVGGLALAGGILAVLAVVLLTSPAEDSGAASPADDGDITPQEELLHNYAAARNSDDIGALMSYVTSRPEQKNHPLKPWDGKKRRAIDPFGYLNGSEEVRQFESQMPAVQGSGSGLEFIDITVNENPVSAPDVEFRWRFFYGADGSESGGEAGCMGGRRGAAFIQDGEIAVLDWGFDDPTACEG